MEIKEIFKQKSELIDKEIITSGWIRFNRPSKVIGFIELTDGTKLNGIQLVYKMDFPKTFQKLSKLSLFSVITVKCKVVEGRNGIELLVVDLIDYREASEEFPIGKKEHGAEFLREVAHLRIKTKLFQSIMKIRHTASIAIHNFLNDDGFIYVNTPIITGNDAEGAGETFLVSTEEGTFYDKQGTLTVSGQLHAEGYAQALKKVYTFGPTFRAEKSNTVRHASEFWMLEPEAAFCDYHEMMKIGWDMIKHVVNVVLKSNDDELQLLKETQKSDLIDYLTNISNSKINKISYREAIDILEKAVIDGVSFEESNIEFGIDLSTEHEKYISGEVFKSPVYVFDYPSDIKSFYMYQNDDGTARGFDLLVPQIGELIGGSQREYRYDILMKTISKKGKNLSELEWYTNLRKNGYADSSGFGLGFERLIMMLTGTENIRDVIPFPRTTGKLNF